MRREFTMAVALLASPLTITPALALKGSDAMSAWRAASDKERSDLLKTLPGAAGKPALRRCLDETAKVAGHGDLAIADVAKACAKDGDATQPV